MIYTSTLADTGVDLVLLLVGDLAPYRIVRSVLRSSLPTYGNHMRNRFCALMVVEEMDVTRILIYPGR